VLPERSAFVLWRTSEEHGRRTLRVPRIASEKKAWEDYRDETNVTSLQGCQFPCPGGARNYRCRILCARGTQYCRTLNFTWYFFWALLAMTHCKIFGRVTFRVRLNHSLINLWNLIACRLILYRNFVSWCLYILCLFPAFYKVIRSLADEHEVMPCSRGDRNRLVFRLVASAIVRAICEKYSYVAWARVVEK